MKSHIEEFLMVKKRSKWKPKFVRLRLLFLLLNKKPYYL